MAVRRLESPLREVEFHLSGRLVPQARSICLAAPFNRWGTAFTQLRRRGKSCVRCWVLALRALLVPFLALLAAYMGYVSWLWRRANTW